MSRRLENNKGAALIELLFSVAMMLIISGSFYQLMISFYQSYEAQDAIAEMQQQGRVAIDLMSREIGQAGYDPTGTIFDPTKKKETAGKVPIANNSMNQCDLKQKTPERVMEASPTFFHYIADLNADAGLSGGEDNDEDVRYEWVGKEGKNSCGDTKPAFTLYRNNGGGAQEVALNIKSFNLTYFDENGIQLLTGTLASNQRALIRKVVVTLQAQTARKDPNYVSNEGYRTRQFVAEIWLKNM